MINKNSGLTWLFGSGECVGELCYSTRSFGCVSAYTQVYVYFDKGSLEQGSLNLEIFLIDWRVIFLFFSCNLLPHCGRGGGSGEYRLSCSGCV